MLGRYDVLGLVHSGISFCIIIKSLNYCFSCGAVLCPAAYLIPGESNFSLRPFLGET